MVTDGNYFFDTYAVIEIIDGSKNYSKYVKAGIILTKLNLFEIYYTLLRNHGKEKAEYYMMQYSQFSVEFNETDIETAAKIKLSNKNLSMTDCIGYAIALRKCVKFLTGDKEFKDLPNVEFVK